jgi:hypothetical protein
LVKEVVLFTGDPALCLFAKSASGNQAVQMEMVFELLIPAMQNSYKSQLSAKLVFTEPYQGLRNGFEEDVKHHGFVSENDGIQLMRQCEHYMEVGHGEQF